jgi:TFIIF-interacting CTD phosphatase-like protein
MNVDSTIRSQALSMRPSLHIEILINGHPCVYYVYKRPHVDHFLRVVAQWYQVSIYTASMASYANPVIDHLERTSGVQIPPHRRYFVMMKFLT